jgi:hypothetical protein
MLAWVLGMVVAGAVDMETLPEPYTRAAWPEAQPTSYGLSPAPDTVLPVVGQLAMDCVAEPPETVVVVPGSGDPTTRGTAGDLPFVAADRDRPASEVLDAVGARQLRGWALRNARRHDAWCSIPLTEARGSWGLPVQAADADADWPDAADAKRVRLLLPPDTPWATLVGYVGFFQRRDAEQEVRFQLSPEAAPVQPLPQPELVPTIDPTKAGGVVRVDGRVEATFESPTRLVHRTGQVLATYADGTITAGVPGEASLRVPTPRGTFEVALLRWAVGGPHVDVDDAGRLRDGPRSVSVDGELDLVQHWMVRLGLGHPRLPHVGIDRVRALADGRILAGAWHGRWSAEGIEVDGEAHALSALSTVEGDTLVCRAPGTPETLERVVVSRLDVWPGEAHTLDHPQVRAACIGAAIDRARYAARGIEGGVIGGVIGGGVPAVPANEIKVRKRVEPEVPDGAEGPGWCKVRFTIDTDGRPTEVSAMGCGGLTVAVEAAALQWRFKPFRVDRIPRSVSFRMRVDLD